MSALAIPASLAAAPPAASPTAPVASGEGGAFATLLGTLARAPAHDDASAAKSKDAAPEADAVASPLQSLEAALSGLAALAAPRPSPAPERAAPTPAAPVNAALSAAVGSLDGGLDVSGRTPLKTMLEADASLGLRDFQMKTFLAAAGATPAKSGEATLDSPLSPLAALAKALAGTTSANAAAPAPVAAAGQTQTARPALPTSSPADGKAASSATNGDFAVARSAAASAASPDASAVADSSGPVTASVPLAALPTFIADQANAFTAEATSAAAPTSPDVAAPKAPQAVKELQISLDPAELGEMTLKLRLAAGKLSVTISVANPKTLTSISDDRDLIAARLGAGPSLDLVIQRQAPAAAPSETAAFDFASDSGAQASPHSRNPNPRRQSAPPGGADPGRDGGAWVV